MELPTLSIDKIKFNKFLRCFDIPNPISFSQSINDWKMNQFHYAFEWAWELPKEWNGPTAQWLVVILSLPFYCSLNDLILRQKSDLKNKKKVGNVNGMTIKLEIESNRRHVWGGQFMLSWCMVAHPLRKA